VGGAGPDFGIQESDPEERFQICLHECLQGLLEGSLVTVEFVGLLPRYSEQLDVAHSSQV